MNRDLVSAMHPPRLPETFAALGIYDLLAAFGFGLMLAAVLLTICAPLMRRRNHRPGLNERLQTAAVLPPPERALLLARLLNERGGTLSQDEQSQLYTGQNLDLAALERRVRHPRRGRP